MSIKQRILLIIVLTVVVIAIAYVIHRVLPNQHNLNSGLLLKLFHGLQLSQTRTHIGFKSFFLVS